MDPLRLPAPCPEKDCGTLLQRCLDEKQGVMPHYKTCHPDVRLADIPFVENPT